MSALAIRNKVGLEGHYRLRVEGPEGQSREDTGWFKNVITDEGLNAYATKTWWLDVCVVGAGNSTPSASDTSLDSFIANSGRGSNTETGSQSDTPPYYAYIRREYTFPAGAAEGNVSEVGISWNGSSTGGDLTSRALILDENEQETTITVLSDEILIVEYEARIYPDFNDNIHSVTDSGDTSTTHTVTSRVNNFANWAVSDQKIGTGLSYPFRAQENTPLGDPMSNTGGAGGAAVSVQVEPYVNDSHEVVYKATWGVDVGNFPQGINFLRAQLDGRREVNYQFGIDPPIMKTSDDKLEIEVKFSWARR